MLDLDDAEKAYTAFYKAAKGVSTEPFLRRLVAADARLTQHQALVLYYVKVLYNMKVSKQFDYQNKMLFE